MVVSQRHDNRQTIVRQALREFVGPFDQYNTRLLGEIIDSQIPNLRGPSEPMKIKVMAFAAAKITNTIS